MNETVQEVMAVLEDASFVSLPAPLTVGGVEFGFEAAARGSEPSHDLVVVATDEIPRTRLRRLVAGLARSLDVAGSRRPVSLVLIGESYAQDRPELERYARVLAVEARKPDRTQIERAVAVLLPLALPRDNLVHSGDPIDEVLGALGPKTTPEHLAFVHAAAEGPYAVREVLSRFVNEGAGWLDEEADDDNG